MPLANDMKNWELLLLGAAILLGYVGIAFLFIYNLYVWFGRLGEALVVMQKLFASLPV